MDDLDHRLLALLRTDSRRPIASIAAALGVSRATAKSRLNKLLENGVITGFTVAVRDPASDAGIRAIVMIAVEGRGVEKVIRQLRGLPQVLRLHSTNGRWDIVAEIAAETLAAFDALLTQVRSIEGITSTETSIFLSSAKA